MSDLRPYGINQEDADSRYVNVSGDTMTGALTINVSSANALLLQDGSANNVNLLRTSTLGATVFNEQGSDIDFRIEGDTQANLLFVDASTDRVGIGTASPAELFSILATANDIGLTIRTTAAAARRIDLSANWASDDGSSVFYTNQGNLNFRVLNTDSNYKFINGTTEIIRFSGLGNIGLGTTTFGTSAEKVLAIKNGVEPTTSPIDMVQLYSVDLSAANATLGLRTETAVVTESITSNRTLSVRINGITFKILLST